MATTRASVDMLLQLAIRHVNAGLRARARVLCDQAMATHPPHPAVHQLLAVLCLDEGDAPGACHHARTSLGLRPDHVPTLVLAADAAAAAGALDESLAYRTRARALEPERPELALALGVAQYGCGLWPVASQTLERVVRDAPGQADAWFQLALVRQDLGDLEGAAAALRRVLELAPRRAEAAVNLGIVLQEAGRVDEALRAYGLAFRLREDSFGRIAHALAAAPAGRLWLDLDALRQALRAVAP